LAVLVEHLESIAQDAASLHAAVCGDLHVEPQHPVDLVERVVDFWIAFSNSIIIMGRLLREA
jgi:hypothetical protein